MKTKKLAPSVEHNPCSSSETSDPWASVPVSGSKMAHGVADAFDTAAQVMAALRSTVFPDPVELVRLKKRLEEAENDLDEVKAGTPDPKSKSDWAKKKILGDFASTIIWRARNEIKQAREAVDLEVQWAQMTRNEMLTTHTANGQQFAARLFSAQGARLAGDANEQNSHLNDMGVLMSTLLGNPDLGGVQAFLDGMVTHILNTLEYDPEAG